MKKTLILTLAGIMMVASGVAAVSAYEAHIINVTAHVENALDVDTTKAEFGVMFPQEWNKIKKKVKLSLSAIDELTPATAEPAAGDLVSVSFKVFAEWKKIPQDPVPDPYPAPVVDIGGTDYYAWIGEWLWVAQDATQTADDPMSIPAEWSNVGAAPDYTIPEMTKEITAVAMTLTDGSDHFLDIMFLAPCFDGFYNADTDVKPDWWPTMWTEPGPWPLVPDPFYGQADPENGVDMGLDLKIQVTNILRFVPS